MRLTLLAATALAALPAALARAEAPFDFDRTPGDLPKTVVPTAYVIDLDPDLKSLTLAGHETVDVTVRQPTATIVMNQSGLKLRGARLEDGSAARVATDDAAETATLTFGKTVPAGKHRLTIDYSGKIPETPAGLYYDDYKTPSGAAQRMLVTQFEVADARRMFPGWDEPAFKATFRLSAVLPSGSAAIANMPVESRRPAGAGLTRVQFATSPRMSTYLLALVSGALSSVDGEAGGAKMHAYAPTGEQDQAGYALSVEEHVLPYYNEYFGVQYPLPKLDLIAIPGNFEAGAMENWGAITFIDNGMLFDPKTSDAATRERIHIYVAHEMAHQWSGDLVTMGWWDNIWLNEGFATWMEFKATDHFNPAWEIWPRQHDAREGAMGQDAVPSTHPIQQPIRSVSEANSAFDEISYQKGEQIIRMIEDWIGPDTFRDGMRAYMKAHAYGNATSADLWAALGAAAHRDVKSVAGTFTEQPGIPLVQVARSCDAGHATLTLTQDRFTIHDPHPAKLSWKVPVSVGGPGVPTSHLLLEGSATVPIRGCDAPAKVNLGEDGYYRTEYDAASLRALTAAFTSFGPADRANLLGDQYAMFRAGREKLATYLDMLPQLKAETDIAVWNDTLRHLRELDGITLESPVRAKFRAYARGLLAPEFARIGWDAKPGESFLDALLRPDLIAALGAFDDPAVTAEAERRFAAFRHDPASLPANIREPVLGIVGHHADQATYDTLRRMGEEATSTEEKLRYYGAMASASDPKLVAQTIAYLDAGKIPNGRVLEVLFEAAQKSDNPDLVWHLTLPEAAKLRERLAPMTRDILLPAAAMGSSNPAIADELKRQEAANDSLGAKVWTARALDAIGTAADLKARGVPELSAWLAQHHGA